MKYCFFRLSSVHEIIFVRDTKNDYLTSNKQNDTISSRTFNR